MSEHVVLAPEGDVSKRRHAHADCVRVQRAGGNLPTRDEWRAAQPPRAGLLRRLLRRG
jgi:hypothetical protein